MIQKYYKKMRPNQQGITSVNLNLMMKLLKSSFLKSLMSVFLKIWATTLVILPTKKLPLRLWRNSLLLMQIY